MATQAEHFERRLAELREYRKAERAAVYELERAARGTHAEFLLAEAYHKQWLDIVRRAAAELGKVYFEE